MLDELVTFSKISWNFWILNSTTTIFVIDTKGQTQDEIVQQGNVFHDTHYSLIPRLCTSLSLHPSSFTYE